MLREVKTTQRMPRMLGLRVQGTGAAAILEGSISGGTLVDNGTGDWTITFATPFARIPVIALASLTADKTLYVASVTASAVQIKARSVGSSPAAADADFHMHVLGFDAADET